MKQRFQNEEIRFVSEQYAGNELYKAVSSIGPQLESELTEFGLCAEECFVETLELLTAIADKADGILPEIEHLWLRKYNEYKRFDRHVHEDEIRKVVGIVFGFTVLALDSSRHPFYRRTLTERLTIIVAKNKWEGWSATLGRIFDVPLPDGWFDCFINEMPGHGDGIHLPKELDSPNARKYFQKAIDRQYMEAVADGTYRWIGTDNKGTKAELAYFLGRAYNYKNDIDGNAGENFPEESLNRLFGVTRLYSSLAQVYEAKKRQRWRSLIDAIFEES